MYLDKLSLINFKNILQTELSFSKKVNCFVGHNGVGKTNLLDAIFYLSFCKSAFNSVDSQNVCHGKDFMLIQGKYALENGEQEDYYCALKGHRKTFKHNGKEYDKLADHIGKVPLVMVSPKDQNLIHGNSEERKRFLNIIISQYNSQYLYEVMRYTKALKQRNSLLKGENIPDADYMDVVEEVMVQAGEMIHRLRDEFLKGFEPIFQKYYALLASSTEKVTLDYSSTWRKGEMVQHLAQTRERDRIVGYTLSGVHRDDLEMNLGGYPIRKEGSQGQNKSYLVALKLAQFEFLKQKGSRCPILLLDDIFDKLDSQRVSKILQVVSQEEFGQIFITDTDRNYISQLVEQTGMDAKIFEVEGGNINEV